MVLAIVMVSDLLLPQQRWRAGEMAVLVLTEAVRASPRGVQIHGRVPGFAGLPNLEGTTVSGPRTVSQRPCRLSLSPRSPVARSEPGRENQVGPGGRWPWRLAQSCMALGVRWAQRTPEVQHPLSSPVPAKYTGAC